MVIYKNIGGGIVKAYSDAGVMIHGGFPEGNYNEALDPASAGRTYIETDIPAETRTYPPYPRRWSRMTIKGALSEYGMIDAAEQYLSSINIRANYTAWKALNDCDYIEEGYPDATCWDAILDGAATALNKSRAEIDALLDALPTE